MSSNTTDDATSSELEILRRRIGELETQLATCEEVAELWQRRADTIHAMHVGLHVYHLEDLDNDRTLRMVDINPAAEVLTGVPAAQVLGRTLDENFPGLRERGIPQAYAQVVRSGEPMLIEDLYYGDARVLQAAFAVRAFPLPNQHVGVTFEVITERKRTEQTLRENERRLRALINSLPIVQFALDREGIFTLSEGQALEKLGLAPGEAVGVSAFDLYREQPIITEQLRRCLEGEPVRYRAKLGDIIFETICHPVYNDQGAIAGIAGVGIDISEEVRAEQESTWLRAIVENTPDVVGMADIQGNVVYMNRAGRQLRGLADDTSVKGLKIADFHPVWASELVMNEGIPQAIREGYWSGSTALLNAHNEEIPVSQVILAHKNAVGELEYMTGMMRDMSEHQRTETALRENEQRLRQFLDALPIGVFVVEPNGQPFYINQLALEILGKGVAPNIVAGQLGAVYNAYITGTDQSYPVERMPLVRSLSGEHSMINDMEIEQPDRRILLEVHGAPILNTDGTVAYGLAAFTDVTLRKQAEAALREHAVQQEMIAAQQAVLHELSTPLMPIARGVVVMPIVGALDSARAQQIMETLLEGIATHDAELAILDITGVKVVDTQVAGALIRAAQAASLLGTRVVLSGIGPEIAQTLVHIGADLREMVAKRSLQQAIAFALAQRDMAEAG